MDLSSIQSLQSLDSLVAKIAQILNTTIDAVYNNLEFYVLEYGKYSFAKTMFSTIAWGLPISIVSGGIVFLLIALMDDFEENHTKIYAISASIFSVIVWFIIILRPILLYNMSPLMYSIEKLMQLIN